MQRCLHILVLAYTFVVLLSSSMPLQAVVITVDTVDEENNVDGDCSLREALLAATWDVPADACPLGSATEMDTIVLPAGTYRLNSTLVVTTNVRFEGDDPETTIIDAGNGFRVIRIPLVVEGGVEFANLTITGGNSGNDTGGGVFNEGSTLTFTNCIITGNGASGPSYGYGGGMYSEQGGSVTFIDSTISGNWAYSDGGGLYAHGHSPAHGPVGVTTLLNTTVTGNWSQWGYGGSMVGLYGTINILTSTVSGNTAPSRGGIVMGFGTVNIADSTIAHNSSSYDGRNLHIISSTATISNSIIANPNSGSNCVKNASASWSSQGFNLSDDASCGLIHPTDLNNAEDGLLPLAHNGGPTQTHALSLSSLATDAGHCTSPGVDQRGAQRPIDIAASANASNGCDIGAYERQAGVLVSDQSISLVEGGASDSFTLTLDTQPSTGSVTVTVTPEAECTVDSLSHVFDSQNWNAPWTVTATAVDDGALEGLHDCHITNLVAGSTDPRYSVDTVVDDVLAEITDNDIGVAITESDGSTVISEDGTVDSYTIKLSTAPSSGSVSFSITPDAECDVNTTSHVFGSGNWNDEITIEVSTPDNGLDDGDRACVVGHAITASGASEYPTSMVLPNVVADVIDDDTATLDLSESGGSTEISEEGVTDSYDMALGSQPSAGTVTVTISPDARCDVDTTSWVFSAANWDDPVMVTVSSLVADNTVDELVRSCRISHTITATGAPEYPLSMPLEAVEASLIDDDAAGILVVQSGGSTAVGEDGSQDSYEIVLTSSPSNGALTIVLEPISPCVVTPAVLAFDGGNWNSPATVTVSALDNGLDEGHYACSIGHVIAQSAMSDAPEYPVDMAIDDVVVTVFDDDTAEVIITESGGITEANEDGTSDSYEIVLGSMPSNGGVELTIVTAGECSTSVSTHVFSAANWDVPLTVTVTTPDNFMDEGDRPCTIAHFITQSPAFEYPTDMPVRDVNATVIDNDTAAVVVVESNGGTVVTEDGSTDTYEIRLGSQPTVGDVVVLITPDELCSVGPNAHGFNASTWDVPVTITVTSTEPDNDVQDGDRVCSILHKVAASDASEYTVGMPVDTVMVTIWDDETHNIFADGFESGDVLSWSS